MEHAETAKLTSLIGDKTSTFIAAWQPHADFLHEMGENTLMVCGFDD